jgi:Pyruvate/2-oxoacid:ferredoxin oxidoreductase delta subunit
MFKGMDIFVYSGTGNTYKVAQCIGEAAEDMGTTYEINMIDINSKPEEHKPSISRLLGLMSPTMGGIQPISFFGFIFRLSKGKGQKVFLAATGAWTKVGPIFIPGYVGFGLYLAALILIFKGYKVVGITGFGMPHNWTTIIPPYWRKLENRINEEIHITAGTFAMNILSGRRIYKRIIDSIVTLLIFPLPILFILFGHLFLAKTMLASSNCSGCSQCAVNCPRKAIKMYGKKHKRPYWTYKCEQCMRCVGYCPQKAVNCNTFLLLAYVLLFSFAPIELLIAKALNKSVTFSLLSRNSILSFIIYYIVVLLLGAAIYAIFYLLNRIPPFNRAFTYLSFSHYWRKYKQPDISVSVLSKKLR